MGKQRARRVRDDDFSSTTYRDWTLRKERPLALRLSLTTLWMPNLRPVAPLAWHDIDRYVL